MKINDLRKIKPPITIENLYCGDWFMYYNELYRVSDYDTDGTMPCICQETGAESNFDLDEKVTPVDVEINIIS